MSKTIEKTFRINGCIYTEKEYIRDFYEPEKWNREECSLAHPHGYFPCSDRGVAVYRREWERPDTGERCSQDQTVCEAHEQTLDGRIDKYILLRRL